jgi:transposase
MSEGLNSQIQKIKSLACGFRNPENFKTGWFQVPSATGE